MGWFWADSVVSVVNASTAPHPIPRSGDISPPPSCPMHKGETTTISKAPAPPAESACPYTPVDISKNAESQSTSRYSKYNPLNYMFSDLSQEKAESQSVSLPTEREPSTIPRGSGEGNWEYPSPQQMYNALLRKGYADTDATAVESMVTVHNFLNEGAWAEIVEWERRFSKGLGNGWDKCKRGEAGSVPYEEALKEDGFVQPSLMRFKGRPKEMTPKAAMIQVMGRIYPSYFGSEPPFDRHDWFVQREHNGRKKEIRYVIDYYSGEEAPNGEPVFYLDVRPAVTPTQAAERLMRWGGDVWYRASGASIREKKN